MATAATKSDRKTSRKLSVDVHRKLSAISNCSDVSNISFKLGMDPGEFKSTISNILGQFSASGVMLAHAAGSWLFSMWSGQANLTRPCHVHGWA